MNSKKSSLRYKYAEQIIARLTSCKAHLQQEFQIENRINSFYIDNLLDEQDAKAIYAAFPDKQDMLLLNDLRERKYVTMQMNQVEPILEEIIYAFQDPRIVSIISNITGLEELMPDEHLYAGGISLMEQGCYLNPHLDNSHDKDRKHYRVLNLLYYVTPDWQLEYGGSLELWDQGLKQPCRVIHNQFNRLVVMATNQSSLHSVRKIKYQGRRCCINNYYFSAKPMNMKHYSHVTSFRGRPEEKIKDVILQTDSLLRNHVPRNLKNLVRKPQFYKK